MANQERSAVRARVAPDGQRWSVALQTDGAARLRPKEASVVTPRSPPPRCPGLVAGMQAPHFWRVFGESVREIWLARAKAGVQSRGLRNRRSEVRILSGASLGNGSSKPNLATHRIPDLRLGWEQERCQEGTRRPDRAPVVCPASGRFSPGRRRSAQAARKSDCGRSRRPCLLSQRSGTER
jgi:hypothetical protein